MDVIFKFVVPLMEMICSLITLALWFKWKFDQGKWSQRTLRPCQRIRFEGGPTSAGSTVRLRLWVGVMVTLDVAAVVFQWVLYVVCVVQHDVSGRPFMESYGFFKRPAEAPFASLWATLILFSTFNQNLWTAVGSSIVGPIAVYEARSRRSLPIYVVGFLSFALAVGPPYALVGVALGGIIGSSTLVALFAALLCTAAVTLIVTLLVVLFYSKRKSHEDASYAFDVVAEIKEQNFRSSLHLMACIIVPHIALALVAAAFLWLDYSWAGGTMGLEEIGLVDPPSSSSSSSDQWNAAFYRNTKTAFACLLAIVSLVKTVVFGVFSYRGGSKCRRRGCMLRGV